MKGDWGRAAKGVGKNLAVQRNGICSETKKRATVPGERHAGILSPSYRVDPAQPQPCWGQLTPAAAPAPAAPATAATQSVGCNAELLRDPWPSRIVLAAGVHLEEAPGMWPLRLLMVLRLDRCRGVTSRV